MVKKYTPMMEQYLKIKSEYKNCLLLFRLGDFYELFFDDAVIASKELEIALTGKDCGVKERAPMCGVPFHSVDGYIAKLIEKGYKVAICEQTKSDKSKTLIKREVVRVITPGTVLDSNILDEGKNNYIMSLYIDKSGFSLSTADISTGEFLTSEFGAKEQNKIIDEISRFNPAEIIANKEDEILNAINNIFGIKAEVYDKWSFDYSNAFKSLTDHFKTLNLSGFGLDGEKLCIQSAGALIDYLKQTQKNGLMHISAIKKYNFDKFMVLDISSRRNLELTSTLRDNSKKGSLLWVLDKTKTSMGARLIRKWLEQPLVDINKINRRLEGIEVFKSDVFSREELKEVLNTIYDIERIMSRVVYCSANAKDLLNLKNSFENLPYIKQLLQYFKSPVTNDIYKSFDCLEDIYSLIDSAICDEAPISLKDGGIIKDGFNKELDELREAKNKGSLWLTELEANERKITGIKNLKIKYNKIFGYYIEVSKSNLSLVPTERYIRRQTLANAERYTTPELKKIEDKILGADEKITSIEYDIFSQLRKSVADEVLRIQKTAADIAVIDALCSLADVADKEGYVKPSLNNQGKIKIVNGRHPVVEKMPATDFIPNDTELDMKANRLFVITGPNMAGKSTYMRQTALIVLMAQAGSFVPAESADIGICDRIFTRVGASDDLATGRSTFMVEMSEVANIINNATPKSLLILDEIGRGTSTFDGLSIAWAVLGHIAKIGARTLFATHYHELTELEGKVDGVKNYSISVEEENNEIVFLRKIIKGAADKSYGIHVARLAGIPEKILKRAQNILDDLSKNDDGKTGKKPKTSQKKEEAEKDDDNFYYTQKRLPKVDLFVDEVDSILEDIDINSLSPIEAWQILRDIKDHFIRIK